MQNQYSRVVMMGLGYIGLPTAALMAKNGLNVLGIDINEKVVETINQGKIHIVEPELGKLVKEVVEAGNLKAATSPREADVFIIAVPTPFQGEHEPDISFVEAATEAIIPVLKENNLFIIESTSPVHTTERMTRKVFEARPELKGKLNIAY